MIASTRARARTAYAVLETFRPLKGWYDVAHVGADDATLVSELCRLTGDRGTFVAIGDGLAARELEPHTRTAKGDTIGAAAEPDSLDLCVIESVNGYARGPDVGEAIAADAWRALRRQGIVIVITDVDHDHAAMDAERLTRGLASAGFATLSAVPWGSPLQRLLGRIQPRRGVLRALRFERSVASHAGLRAAGLGTRALAVLGQKP